MLHIKESKHIHISPVDSISWLQGYIGRPYFKTNKEQTRVWWWSRLLGDGIYHWDSAILCHSLVFQLSIFLLSFDILSPFPESMFICKTHILSFWQYSSSLLEPCFSFCYLLASLYYPIKCGLDFSKCFYARFIERDWRKDLVVWILDALPEDPGSVPSTILSYHGYHD